MTHEETFLSCMTSILVHEGGLSLDRRDPGGATQWGISLRYLRSIGYDINGDGKIDKEDIIGLPLKGAVGIYRKYWWDKYHYAAFNELLVVEKVFDLAVNMGGNAAHKLLQIAINRLREKPIVVDGLLGGLTFGAANGTDAYQLRQELRECAEHKYIEILAANPAMEWARRGWDESSTVVTATPKRHTESNEQIAAMDWLRAQHPKIAEHTLHIGNERKSSYYAGYIMKRMGVLKGASDLLVAYPVSPFHGLFIEVKSKMGRPTPEQKAFIERMRAVGYRAEICYGADEVINTIKSYLRGYQGISSSAIPES